MAKVTKPPPPDHLTMRLFAPGMTLLHRAGLGGLACTLKYIERARDSGAVLEEDLPGGPWPDGRLPWDIGERTVTLRFGKPEAAGEFLKRLFKIAFDIKDGLIYLPGQYTQVPSLAVRSTLQLGLTLTFLQFGPHRQLAEAVPYSIDPEGSGIPSPHDRLPAL
jgi:hypothetical protein